MSARPRRRSAASAPPGDPRGVRVRSRRSRSPAPSITDSTARVAADGAAPICVRGSRRPAAAEVVDHAATGTRPAVGFNAASPQKCAGSRTLAPESVPSRRRAAGDRRRLAAAGPAADRGVGFRAPEDLVVVSIPPPTAAVGLADDDRAAPRAGATPPRRRATRAPLGPPRQRQPATAMLSLTENGTPHSGPSPRSANSAIATNAFDRAVDRATCASTPRRRDLARGDQREQFGGRPVDELHRPTVQD